MFEAKILNPKILRDSIDTIAQLIDEGNFKLKKDGIEFVATDRAMVAVVDFKMSSDAFEDYKCNSEEIIGINLLNFLNVLKRIMPTDSMTMRISDDKAKLDVILEGESKRKFAIPLLNVSNEDLPPVDQFTFNASVQMNADVLTQGIDDADIIADSLIMELDPEGIKMSASGNGSNTEFHIGKENPIIIKLNASQKIKSRYPLEYLKKMFKASKISNIVEIKLGNDYPMRLDFLGKEARMSFILAPRVSDEE